MKHVHVVVFVLLCLSGLQSCTDDSADGTAALSSSLLSSSALTATESAPGKLSAAEQEELFKTYVAIGDSLTLGCQGLNLEEHRQYYCYPAQIARSMNTPFRMPLVNYPGVGIPNPEDAFRNGWLNTYRSSYNILVKTLVGWKRADDYADQPSLNCFAAVGATLDQMLSYDPGKLLSPATSFIQDLVGLVSPFIQASIGGRDIWNHRSLVDQAMYREPTFLTVWLGNNDTMYSTVLGDPGSSTSVENFRQNFEILAGKIKALRSLKGIVVINIPDNTTVPFLQPVGNPYNTVKANAAIPQGSMVPFFVTNTYDVSQVVTPAEIEKIRARTMALNAVIREICDREGWPLIDACALFNELKQKGARLRYADGSESGIVLTFDYATGGFFSLDGMHPTSAAYAYIANEGIKKINEFYRTSLPLVDEVEVWRHDSLCQSPLDPRTGGTTVMGNLTFLFNSIFAAMGMIL